MTKLKTIKELATQFNIGKDKVYRILDQHNVQPTNTSQKKNKYYYDEIAPQTIAKYLNLKANYKSPHALEKKYHIKGSVIYQWIKNHEVEFSMVNGHVRFNKEQEAKLVKYHKLILDDQQKIHRETQQLANRLNLSFKLTLQILAKFNLKAEDYQPNKYPKVDMLIQEAKNRNKNQSQILQNFYDSKKIPPRNELMLLTDITKQYHISYKVVNHFSRLNYFPVYRIVIKKGPRLFTTKKAAAKLAHDYLNYPDEPLFTVKEISKLFDVPEFRIHHYLKITNQSLTKILGDDQKYLTEAQVNNFKLWKQKNPNYHTKAKKEKEIKVNTDLNYDGNHHATASDVANQLQTNTHSVIRWAKNNQIPYLYNQKHQLFFDSHQVRAIRSIYLNYPEINMPNKSEVMEQLHISDTKLNTISKKLKIKAVKVLGDRRNLYTKKQIAQLKKYLNEH